MIFNKTEQQERAYLQYVIGVIKDIISSVDVSVKNHVDTLQEYKDYIWSNKDIDPHEIRSMRESILNHYALGEKVINKRGRIARILDIPYFGRIDFKEKGKTGTILPVYIGVHTFYDPQNKVNLIYDWRAPISGMFYDSELGETSYQSPAGDILGEIMLKRQYRIRTGKMEFMIESSLAVHDEILQKELSVNADDKMRNIVSTIQREQNQIIRNEDAHILIIQGVAGSGKTSIALHRIAYLLYAMKGELTSKNILIISPNKVFADYISNVLPELGEENVPETTMEQILSGVLESKYKYQTFFEQVTELLDKPTLGCIERIQYKASFDFISQLDRFVLHIENHYFKAIDVKLTKYITIPADFIDEQFRRFNRYPMRMRFEIMTDYILEMMEIKYQITVARAERNTLRNEIKKMFAANNDLQVYKDFFEWTGKSDMFKMRKNRVLEYSDLAPLAYLHIALEGKGVQGCVKHLLIDEMQDYSPIQYKVIQRLYSCRKTILGDAEQSVNPYGSSNADLIQRSFVTGKVMKLCKSYRSTYEITDFAQRIRTNKDLEPVARHGEKPGLIRYKSREKEIQGIIDLVIAFTATAGRSLGIICKIEQEAKEMVDYLKDKIEDIYFLSSCSSAFVNGVVVTSAHVAKGLEFDEVIIPHAGSENYCSEIDRSMLYVAATRAMHKLTLTYSGELNKFIL